MPPLYVGGRVVGVVIACGTALGAANLSRRLTSRRNLLARRTVTVGRWTGRACALAGVGVFGVTVAGVVCGTVGGATVVGGATGATGGGDMVIDKVIAGTGMSAGSGSADGTVVVAVALVVVVVVIGSDSASFSVPSRPAH